jgi:glutaredoxin
MTRFVCAVGLLLGLAAAYDAIPVAASAAERSSQHHHDIVMYVMPGCGYCAKAREYLGQRGLQWREIDITGSAAANSEFEQKGGVGTPLILVDGSVVQGFNAQRMDAVLGKP